VGTGKPVEITKKEKFSSGEGLVVARNALCVEKRDWKGPEYPKVAEN